MIGTSPQQWAQQALAAAQSGDLLSARQILAQGLQQYPKEAGLWHAGGSMLLQAGDAPSAAKHFGKAFELDPKTFDYAVDQAIALSNAMEHGEAIEILKQVEKVGKRFAHYCSTRANAERGRGNLAEAELWYDRALRIEPSRPKPLLGRANVALERGEDDAVARFDASLRVEQGNPYGWLGKAQALDVAGDVEGARTIMQQLANQVPQFTDGLRFLAQLRLGAGESDFASHYGDAARTMPADPNILFEWCKVLAGLDYNAEAAEIAARARKAFPAQEYFALLEAVYAGAAGDDERAEAIFADLGSEVFDRHLHEARHRIRRGEYDLAETLLDIAAQQLPNDIGVWALRSILWRLTENPREEWLHGQEGLYRIIPLHSAATVLPAVKAVLHRLHDGSPLPLGQSLRGGTQTRGRLFDRKEPELARLKKAIEASIEQFREHLPAEDSAHPLLQHRNAPWAITGSWSVRLSGGDHHTSHIHPQGILSSALYIELPDEMAGSDDLAGALELGRSPPDLRVDLPPIDTFAPREAHLALFPSTMYHGTRPFSGGPRLTVAFDVTVKQ